MKDWKSQQNGTLGRIAGKGQVCRGWGGGGGFPLLPVKFAFTPTCLGRPPQSLQQTLQGPLSLLLCWVSPFSSSLGAPRFPLASNPGSGLLWGCILAALQDHVWGEPGGVSLVERHVFRSGSLTTLNSLCPVDRVKGGKEGEDVAHALGWGVGCQSGGGMRPHGLMGRTLDHESGIPFQPDADFL